MTKYVQRRFKIEQRYSDALDKMVEDKGGTVLPDHFVNLALEAMIGSADNGTETPARDTVAV